ncbi:hypothetical protein IMCC3317_38590 [Kordia antarctica]|uniref:Uncharacterized protein n=1 Tax=Kordia antarctica TaxID=1218801 RepID=A0A7L4ZQM0_9FLAO|nr:hypothetical protein [Kordia antarctica]QHI38466.1 hypothetical protein IMCC3317_38590 [Kordia antarctica]
MEHSKIEEAYNETFGGLTMFYRDCELNPYFISKYTKNQILQERGFTDVSTFAEGLSTNLRYAIASNKARDLTQINPNVKKYGFCIIQSSSHYKVLDIYKIGAQTQILLLHFDEKFTPVFSGTKSNIEENVIKKGRESFDKKLQMKPNVFLNEDEWKQRTQFPIGMSDAGDFFLASADKTSGEKMSNASTTEEAEIPKTTNVSEKPSNQRKEKKSFWKRLFG